MTPVEISLPDGRSLRARGRIDRVDQVQGADANAFAIWDYKTGGTWKYEQAPQPFWEGRVVQHILSILVMKARLKAIAQQVPGAKIDRFGFFFPSEKGAGERIEYTPAELEQGSDVLARLARIAATGAFLATTRHDKDCSFCDFQAICGDVAAVAAASTRKLANTTNALLSPTGICAMAKRTTKPATRSIDDRSTALSERARWRQRELDRNMLVEAAAGTGKTTSLVARMINLLAGVDAASTRSPR